MVAVPVFCKTCGRYLGIESFCPECQQERPPIERLAQPGQPLHTESVPSLGSGQFYHGEESWFFQVGRDGYLHAFQSESGRRLWSHNIGQSLRTETARQQSRLYLSSRQSAMLLALDIGPDGVSEAWRYPLRGAGGGVTAYDSTIYLGDGQGYLYALRDVGSEAELVWTQAADLQQSISAAPVCWRRLVLTATRHANGRLQAITTDRGQPWWKEPIPINDRVSHAPVVVGDRLLLTTQRGDLHLLQLPDGQRVGALPKRLPVAVSAPLLVVGKLVYLGLENGRVLACDMAAGRLLGVAAPAEKPIRSLAFWEKLLFVADDGGMVTAVEADTNKIAWRWSGGAPLQGGLLVENGRVIVGQTEQLSVLPWHLGQWGWAAAWCDRQGHQEAAGNCYALAGQKEKAAQRWQTAGKFRLSAQLWATLGMDQEAAQAFREAAEREGAETPTRSSGLWIRAAYHFDRANMKGDASKCQHKAGRIGKFAYLEIESFNLPLFEVGQPGQVTLWLRNLGNDSARSIRVWLGGELEKALELSLDSLGHGETRPITFNDVIPSGTDMILKAALFYDGGARQHSFTQMEWSLAVSALPPGAIEVRGGEVGAIIVRVPEGAERPSVRIRGGMVGLVKIKYETQPVTALPDQTMFPGKQGDDRNLSETVTAETGDLPPSSQVLLGKYEVLGLIAEGGMGAIYKAYDRQAGRLVAIKMLATGRRQDIKLQEQFKKEARIISSLEHPAILPVYDYGDVNGNAYLVMRYVSGGTLQDRINKSPLSPTEAANLLHTIANGLTKAHKRNVVHRDIKGANILLDEDNNPYLADFGIAQLVDAATAFAGSGTPPYMAPEQWLGKEITPQTDVYQLGLLLFEMLTGRRPFQAQSREQYRDQHLKQSPPRLQEINPNLHPAYDAVIQQATAKDPTKRFSNAAKLANTFRQAVIRTIRIR